MADAFWNFLLVRAEREVRATLAALPARLREAAQGLPVLYEHFPSDELVADGVEPDTLGLFVGSAFPDEEGGGALPPQIILYLENLWDAADGVEAVYAREIRTTLLHELGHYLGLDEADLEARGLE